MKKIIYLIALLIVQIINVSAQNERYSNSNLKQKIEGLKQAGEIFHPVQMLEYKGEEQPENVGNYFTYALNVQKLKETFSSN